MTDQKRTTLADLGLFTGVPQHENFCRLKDLLDVVEMPSSSKPHVWPEGDPVGLPESFEFGGTRCDTEDFLTGTDTAALLGPVL